MDIKRPRQKVQRQIKRSTIALDDYMFDRKMQSLYYGKKPVSDDRPALIKFIAGSARVVKREVIALPASVKKLYMRLIRSVKKYPIRFLSGTLALCFLVVFGVAQMNNYKATHAPSKSGDAKNATGAQGDAAPSQPVQSRIPLNQKPEFAVVLPQGKVIADFGGWAKVSPAGAPATYAYKDSIGTATLLVSEQLLPENFKTNTSAEVQKMAIGFNANQAVKTEKVEFFIGSNTDGEQSVITYTKTLLIFLKSSSKITKERWQTYIENLK